MALAAALAAKKAKMGFKSEEEVKIDTSGPEADLAHPFFGKLKQNNGNKLSPRSRRLQEMTGGENADKENDNKNTSTNIPSATAAQKPALKPPAPPPAPPAPAPVMQQPPAAPSQTRFPRDDDDDYVNTSTMGNNTLPVPAKPVDLMAAFSPAATSGTLV
jgi:hypothetical protein